MQRDLGEIAVLQDLVPEPLAFPIALLTQLGAIWFAAVMIALVYRYHDREQAVVMAGLLVTGTAVWRTIKIIWPIPRPNQPFIELAELPFILQPIFELAVVDTGPGFPSGHAVTTAIIYLSLARYLAIGTPWQRYGAAFVIIGLVGFTRITLGVHFLVDVIAGAVIGNVLLFGFVALVHHTALDRDTFALSLGVAAAAICLFANLVVPPTDFWEIGLFIAGVSGFIWWEYLEKDRVKIGIEDPT